MKYILSIIPFSTEGLRLADTALCIAKRLGATLLLLPNGEALLPDKVKETSGNDAVVEEAYLSSVEFIRVLKKDMHTLEDPFVEYIQEQDLMEDPGKISPKEIGLIIGYEENTFSDPGLKGSLISRLMKTVNCPILKLNRYKTLKLIRRLGYVTDLRYCDTAILKLLVGFCRPYNTELLIIHVTASGLPDIENDDVENLFATELVPMMNYRNVGLVNLLGKDTINDIKNFTEVLKPDVIALSNKKYWFYDRLFPDSTTQRPAYADIPLMLFN